MCVLYYTHRHHNKIKKKKKEAMLHTHKKDIYIQSVEPKQGTYIHTVVHTAVGVTVRAAVRAVSV